LNDIFGMWRRRSALCLCGIGVLEPEKEEHPTTPQIVEVHQRRPHASRRCLRKCVRCVFQK